MKRLRKCLLWIYMTALMSACETPPYLPEIINKPVAFEVRTISAQTPIQLAEGFTLQKGDLEAKITYIDEDYYPRLKLRQGNKRVYLKIKDVKSYLEKDYHPSYDLEIETAEEQEYIFRIEKIFAKKPDHTRIADEVSQQFICTVMAPDGLNCADGKIEYTHYKAEYGAFRFHYDLRVLKRSESDKRRLIRISQAISKPTSETQERLIRTF